MADTSSRGFTAELASRTSSLGLGDLEGPRIERVRQAALDWVGVTVAGAGEDVSRSVARVVRLESTGPCALVGATGRCGPQAAALANGTASHAQDFDDVSFWMHGHPSAVVAPAVFAVAELRGLAGADAVVALAAGYEATAVLGLAAGVEHYVAGWHSTGTIGAVAAAAGAARALDLDRGVTERALALAALQASGLKVSFGTMAKPIHAGRAAAAGVLAALLAEAGCTAPTGALEAPDGFAGVLAPDLQPARAAAEMGGRLGLEAVAFKQYPACGGTHASIDGVRRVLEERGVTGRDVERVELRVTRQMEDICCIAEPRTGHEGMFSVRHAAALVLAGRETSAAGFTDDAVRAPDVVAARDRVVVTTHPERETGITTEVTVVLSSGERIVEDRPQRVPATDDELEAQRERLAAKFHDLVDPVVGAETAAELAARLVALEREPRLGELLALTQA
jgi:2-methylcitrate dehydratase PrpD